jgi:hypothetical protein
MKRIIVLTLFLAAGLLAADETAAPEINTAIQLEVLATQFELASAQAAAASYIAALKKAETAAAPALERATKACNAKGGAKYEATYRDRKVVCVVAPKTPASPPAPR